LVTFTFTRCCCALRLRLRFTFTCVYAFTFDFTFAFYTAHTFTFVYVVAFTFTRLDFTFYTRFTRYIVTLLPRCVGLIPHTHGFCICCLRCCHTTFAHHTCGCYTLLRLHTHTTHVRTHVRYGWDCRVPVLLRLITRLFTVGPLPFVGYVTLRSRLPHTHVWLITDLPHVCCHGLLHRYIYRSWLHTTLHVVAFGYTRYGYGYVVARLHTARLIVVDCYRCWLGPVPRLHTRYHHTRLFYVYRSRLRLFVTVGLHFTPFGYTLLGWLVYTR